MHIKNIYKKFFNSISYFKYIHENFNDYFKMTVVAEAKSELYDSNTFLFQMKNKDILLSEQVNEYVKNAISYRIETCNDVESLIPIANKIINDYNELFSSYKDFDTIELIREKVKHDNEMKLFSSVKI